MQCRNCGAQLPEGAGLCEKCGASQVPPPPLAPTMTLPQRAVTLPQRAMTLPQRAYKSPGADANDKPLMTLPQRAVTLPQRAMTLPQRAYKNPDADANDKPLIQDSAIIASPSSGLGSEADEMVQNPYSNTRPLSVSTGLLSAYVSPQSSNVSPYVPPQPNDISPSASPSQSEIASYGTAEVPAFAGALPKRKSKVKLIVGVGTAVLLVAFIGSMFAVFHFVGTPTQGNTVNSTASSIVTHIQTARDVDTTTAQPTSPSTSFQTGDLAYVTFQFDFRNTDVSQQKPGYVQAKYYSQNSELHTTTILRIDDTVATDGQGYGYFGYRYDNATTAGSVNVYWCRKPSCADRLLAGSATFTVN